MALSAALPAAAQSTLALEFVADTADGLVDPIGMASVPGDPRLFLVEIGGQVRILEDGGLAPAPFLDVSAHIDMTIATGLRAIAFHPDYGATGHVYLWYDAPSATGAIVDIVLARMTRSLGNPDQVDPGSLVELLREPQANRGHACGNLHFGPDGMLYALLGDGGNPQDPMCNSQDPASLMGNLLRLDVDSAFPYAIPGDNPFVMDPAVRDEVWHVGFRHPWKWSFDAGTGDLWIADVGQATREEIDFVAAGDPGGRNFGWKVMEGTTCFNTTNCPAGLPPCGDPAYTLPLYEYDHSVGCSITGGFVYRGNDIPDLRGTYLYADFCSGRFWALREVGGAAAPPIERTAEFTPGGGRAMTAPVTFGEDGRGELYVIDYDGKELFKIVRQDTVIRYCEGAVNSTGVGGRAAALGSTSLGANDLLLLAGGLPSQTFGLFFYGPDITRTPTGDGFICVDGGATGIFRLGAAQASPAGLLQSAFDVGVPPASMGPGQVFPGSTWAFQCAYRDASAPGTASFNFTDALSVQFTP